MASTQGQPSVPGSHKQSSSSTPPVRISSHCHLDGGSYVKGHQTLTIEANAVIHPRTRLFTDSGPITIRQGTIISEKCYIGKEARQQHQRQQASVTESPAAKDSKNVYELRQAGPTHTGPEEGLPIVIDPRVYLHSATTLLPPCTICEGVILEAGVTISPNCTVGAHSKVCAGITLPVGTNIPEWTVVYGFGGMMRRRRQVDAAEESRLEGMSRERQGTEAVLKTNTTKNLSSVDGGSRNKRESMLRAESTKG